MPGENATSYDLLLAGGHVIDPSQGIDEVADVAITGGKIAGVGRRLDSGDARECLDVRGKFGHTRVTLRRIFLQSLQRI